MSLRWVVILVPLAAFVLAAPARCALMNPGFEDGLSYWTQGNGPWREYYTTTGESLGLTPQGGQSFLQMEAQSYRSVTGQALSGVASVSQTAALSSGETLSGWGAYRPQGPASGYAQVVVYDQPSGATLAVPFHTTASTSTWVPWSWTAPSDGTYTLTYRLVIAASPNIGTLSGYAFLDAPQSAVPEPTSIALLALAVGGIGAMLRRRPKQ